MMEAERFLNVLKKAVADRDLAKTKGYYTLRVHFKKKATTADKPKKASKKK